MNGSRWTSGLPLLVFLAVALWLGLTAWELERERADEARLRARFEELLELPPTPPRQAEPLDPVELPEIYGELVARALDLGLEVREVNPGLEDGLLVVEGRFDEAYALLDVVRRLERPVWVKGLDVTRLDDEGQRLSVTYTIGIRLTEPEEEGFEEPAP